MTRVLHLGLALAVASAATGLALAQSGTLVIPEPTREGSLDGSWYYTDPGYNIALFIDAKNAKPLVTYELRAKGGIKLRTDLAGHAQALDNSSQVELSFKGHLDRASGQILGEYQRTVTTEEGKAREGGAFKLYRSEAGSKLVLLYPEYKRSVISKAGATKESVSKNVLLVFRKASEIVVDYDELPF